MINCQFVIGYLFIFTWCWSTSDLGAFTNWYPSAPPLSQKSTRRWTTEEGSQTRSQRSWTPHFRSKRPSIQFWRRRRRIGWRSAQVDEELHRRKTHGQLQGRLRRRHWQVGGVNNQLCIMYQVKNEPFMCWFVNIECMCCNGGDQWRGKMGYPGKMSRPLCSARLLVYANF